MHGTIKVMNEIRLPTINQYENCISRTHSPNAIKDAARVVDGPEISSSVKNAIKYGNNDIVTRAVSRNV